MMMPGKVWGLKASPDGSRGRQRQKGKIGRQTEDSGDALDFVGKTFSSSTRFWIDDITESMYVGAERATCFRS